MSLFKAWRTGSTGYPLVDAGMREVWSTGWMHNRIRVVAASFMVKILLLPWQWGLKHYWDALLDADLECDALGWQYCAGCLSDAHPLEYVMDLEAEAKRFDPGGMYVRRWLPVLARLPAKYIHSPWEAPPEVLADAGVELGVNYPWPVVDMEDSKSALASVVKVVEEAKEAKEATATGPIGAGIGGAGVTDGGAGAGITGTAACPFRPATRPDPAAAVRVWGPSGGTLISDGEVAMGMPRQIVPGIPIAERSLRNTGDSTDEEVESNIGTHGGGGSGSGTAAARTSLTGNQGYSYAGPRSVRGTPATTARTVKQTTTNGRASIADAGAAASTPHTFRPPAPAVRAPIIQQPIAAWEPAHTRAEAVLLDALGMTPGSNGVGVGAVRATTGSGRRGASGGSNRPSLTIAVVPTMSEDPKDAHRVPDTSVPMDDDSRLRQYREEESKEESGDRDQDYSPRQDDNQYHRSHSPPAELYGQAEGTARDHPAPEHGADASEGEAVWPPESKRQRHNDQY